MISFAKNLYLGESAAEDKYKIIHDIKKHKLRFGVYVIALSVNGKDVFDIIPAYMIGKDNYKGKDIHILALAGSKAEAMDVVSDMIMDVYRETKDVDVRGYFS